MSSSLAVARSAAFTAAPVIDVAPLVRGLRWGLVFVVAGFWAPLATAVVLWRRQHAGRASYASLMNA